LILTNSSFMTSAVPSPQSFHVHDVAPVAGGITNREQDGLIGALCFRERIRTPRPPVDRVVLVLQQIRAVSRASRFSWAGSDDDDMFLGALRFRLIYRAAITEPPETDDRITA
jgi:hypothetical protein